MKILALDIATNTGFAIGDTADLVPAFGSVRFIKPGSSHQALFGNALKWAADFLQRHNPERIIYEAPLQFRGGKSRAGNDEILHGLPAVILAAAYYRDIFDIHKAPVRDVRVHFIRSNPKREFAKQRTIARCKQLGWYVEDDNQADACALWDYACAQVRQENVLARVV